MNILILEDEPRNAKRLIRLLNDIDRTFIVEGPLASIKETVEFFQSGKTTNLILADIRLTDGLSFEALKCPGNHTHHIYHRIRRICGTSIQVQQFRLSSETVGFG